MIGFFRVLRAKINIFGKIRTDLTVPVFPQWLPDGAIKLSDRHKTHQSTSHLSSATVWQIFGPYEGSCRIEAASQIKTTTGFTILRQNFITYLNSCCMVTRNFNSAKNGTFALHGSAISANSRSSVRTIISSNCREVCGARTDHSNIGQPLKHRMFLRGILLLPPRAGIIAIVFRG